MIPKCNCGIFLLVLCLFFIFDRQRIRIEWLLDISLEKILNDYACIDGNLLLKLLNKMKIYYSIHFTAVIMIRILCATIISVVVQEASVQVSNIYCSLSSSNRHGFIRR